MHKNSGITLMTLVIAIIIISMISGITIVISLSAYDTARVSNFVARMNIIQERVNVEYIKIKNGDTNIESYGENIPDSEKERAKIALNSDDFSNFRYFNKNTLKRDLSVDNIDETVIINFETREVYSLEGIEYKNKMYYTQYDLPGGQKNINYNENIDTSQKPDFEIEKLNYGLYSTINIKESENTKIENVFYGKVTSKENETINVDYWKKVANNSIDIKQTGKYAIKIVDIQGKENIKEVSIVLTNEPLLSEGMVPIVYDQNEKKWKKVATTDGVWYDYSEKKWANVTLKDELVLDDNNYVTNMGSMFVWIPRFAYRITSNYHKKDTGSIEIKFLSGTTILSTDDEVSAINNKAGENNWNIPEAFVDDSENDFSNGGWNKELTGMWVAKFEASSSEPGDAEDATITNGGGDNTSLHLKILPNVKSWREISEENMFQKCLNMNANGNIYGLPSYAISHQMKNSEWGAIAYLTQSEYGNNSEIYINNSTRFITGNAGDSTDATGVNGTVNSYSEINGQKASSTGNIYGIYDLSGGGIERLASFVGTSTNISENAKSIAELDSINKYLVDIYPEKYLDNESRYGDAIYETSSNSIESNSWNNDGSIYLTLEKPFMTRGGFSGNGSNAGVFAYYNNNGSADINIGFRPVIII